MKEVLSIEEVDKGRDRSLPRGLAIVNKVILVTISILGILYILQVHLYLHIYLLEVQHLALLLSLALAAIFMLIPGRKGSALQHMPWYDIGLALLSMAFGGYVVVNWSDLLMSPTVTTLNVGLGVAATFVLLEATRRTLGWPLVFFALGSIGLALWGNSFHLHFIKYSWQRWFYLFYLNENGIYCNVLALVVTIIFGFIVFGRLLVYTGGGRLLINLTLSLLGRYTGGVGKASVVASALMGTITGSIAVNAVTIGNITIPLMKQYGYRPAFAAGVESAASTGGPIMPPVMGVMAFLVAQFLGIPYYQVAIAAFLPAIIYYLCVFIQVDAEARAVGLKGIPVEQLPSKGNALIGALPFLIPAAVIVYTLFLLHISPGRVGLYGAASVALLGLFYKSGRRNLAYFHRILEDVGRGFLELMVIGGIAGLITAPLVLSGIGMDLVTGFRDMSGGGVFSLLMVAAIANLILGLGLPGIITYVLMAVLTVPTLIQAGILPLSAHLFTLYLAVAAELTPPAGTPIFITMIIARAGFLETAIAGMRLASAIFILPFTFVYRPGLLLQAPAWTILSDFFLTALGLSALALGFEGYVGGKISLWERTILCLAGVAFLVPRWEINVLGVIAVLGLAGFWRWTKGP
jgi:TRAP transporter 4TM/12TM fusion protein